MLQGQLVKVNINHVCLPEQDSDLLLARYPPCRCLEDREAGRKEGKGGGRMGEGKEKAKMKKGISD